MTINALFKRWAIAGGALSGLLIAGLAFSASPTDANIDYVNPPQGTQAGLGQPAAKVANTPKSASDAKGINVSKSAPAAPLSESRKAGNVVSIIGSTLVAAYAKALSEHLSAQTGLPPAEMHNEGTTRGIKGFCAGVGIEYPDVLASSRKMRTPEFNDCIEHGAKDLLEIMIGYDAAVLVSRIDDETYDLKLGSIYKAVAAEYPEGYEFQPNHYATWNQLDPNLPNTEIRLVLPTPNLGGRGFFEDFVLQSACRKISGIKAIFSADDRIKQCVNLRKDGRIVELDTPYDANVMNYLSKAPRGTMAFMPMRFAKEHPDVFKLQPINGVMPSAEDVSKHRYQFVRYLYFYVKKDHMKDYHGKGLVKGLREFVTEVTREETLGPDGYLSKLGLIPMPEERRRIVRDNSLLLTPMER
ncbi:MAG: substrate-binding domain-containing protein [Pseudomonadota bacterium]